MPDQPPPSPPERRRVRYQKPLKPGQGGVLAGAAVCLTLGAGVVLVLVSGAMSPTQGSRASTRLRWEERRAEINRIADQAEADGKLRRP
jgi:hypothetical protein